MGWTTVRYEYAAAFPDGFKASYLQEYPELSHCDVLVKSSIESEVDMLYETSGLCRIRIGLFFDEKTELINDDFVISFYDDNGEVLLQMNSSQLVMESRRVGSYTYQAYSTDYVLDLLRSKENDYELAIEFLASDSCAKGVVKQKFLREVYRGIFSFGT